MAFKTEQRFVVPLLLIVMSLFIITIVTLVAYNYHHSKQDLTLTSQEFINLTNDAATADLDDFLKPAGITKITAQMFENKTLNLKSPELIDNLSNILQTYPQLASIYIIDAKGAMIAVLRANSDPSQNLFYIPNPTPDTTLVTEIMNQNQTSIHWNYFDNQGQLIKTEQDDNQFNDPRLQSFYQGALLNQGYWIGMFTSFNNNTGITVAYPIISNNQVQGVIAVDFNTNTIADFLTQLQNVLSSTIFIVDDQGQVLKANSDNQNNNIVNASLVNASTKNQKIFSLNNVAFVSTINTYTTNYNANWRIGITLPLQTLINNALRIDKTMLYFAGGMLIILILATWAYTRRLSRPIKKLTEETQKINQLKFNEITWPPSHVKEINSITKALNQTTHALDQAMQYLPNTLVKKLLNANQISKLNTEQKNLSFLSAYINNFERLMNKKDLDQVTEQLSQDLSLLSEIIEDHQGTIDQYQGDLIHAVFGAPTEDEKHIRHACISTLIARKYLNNPNITFGLHNGRSLIGNIKSHNQLHYLALGKTANLSSSIAKYNNKYQTRILASYPFYQAAQHEFLFRPIDIVNINNENILLYELVGASYPNAPETILVNQNQIEFCTLSHQAFSAYREQNKEKAKKLLEQLLQKYPQDAWARTILSNL